jgi:hypothetical protein
MGADPRFEQRRKLQCLQSGMACKGQNATPAGIRGAWKQSFNATLHGGR